MRRILQPAVSFLFLLLIVNMASALAQNATFYVDRCPKDPGNGSAVRPFNTLGRGRTAAEAVPASTLVIHSGSYTALSFDGSAKGLTLRAEHGPVQIGLVDQIHLDAVDALMARYKEGLGSWGNGQDPIQKPSGWWYMAPSALTTLIDYMIRTGDRCYASVVADVYDKNKGKDYTFTPGHDKDFLNIFIDDSAWWGLAWVRAYDLTSEPRYLQAARVVADWMWQRGMEHPNNPNASRVCEGGLWWLAEPRPPNMPPPKTKEEAEKERRVKNAITNELYIVLAASLHNRIPGDIDYLKKAMIIWGWFRRSKMMQPNISSPYRPLLIRDVVYDKLDHPSLNCDDAADIKFTPPQGIILGGLVELYRGTGNTALLDIADAIANATIDQTRRSERMVYQQGSPHQGVLREDFEEAFACHDPSKQTCVSDDQVKFRWAPCNPATDPRKCVVIDVLDDPLSMSKGVFVRHLRTLYDQNQALGRSTYKWASFFRRQRESLIAHARVGTADFGYFWTGPVTKVDFVTQASAIDALTAALGL